MTKAIIQSLVMGTGLLIAKTTFAQNISSYDWINTQVAAATHNASVHSTVINTANNQVFAIGTFTGTITLNSTTLNSSGGNDIFIMRFHTNGTPQAIAKLGSTGDDQGKCIAWMNTTTTGLVIGGSYDGKILVHCINPSFANGAILTPPATAVQPFAQDIGMTTGFAKEIVNNKLIATGWFTGDATFGASSLIAGNRTSFVSKINTYTATGVTWSGAIQPDINIDNGDDEANAIVYSTVTNRIYITGYFKGQNRFGTTAPTMTAAGPRDIYIAAVNPATMAFVPGDQRQIGSSNSEVIGGGFGSDHEIGYTLATDVNGLFVGGRLNGIVTFGGPTPINVSRGGSWGFIARYNFTGGNLGSTTTTTVAAISQMSGSNNVPVVYSLACDGAGRIYYSGFAGTNTLVEDPTNSSNNINLKRALTNLTQYRCGMIGSYQTSNCALLWADRISQVYNPSEEYAVGNSVAIANCKLYLVGQIINRISAGNLSVGTALRTSSFVSALEPSLQLINGNPASGCYPSVPVNIPLTAATQFGGTLNWTGGSVSPTTGASVTATISNYGSTTYTVTTSGGTCPGQNASVTITINPSASGNTNAGPDISNCCWTGSPVTIGTPAVSGLTYSWSPSTGLNNASIAQPQVTISGSRTYTLTVTDQCGNAVTDNVSVNLNAGCCFTSPNNPGTSSVDNAHTRGFDLYPNPTTAVFKIEFKDDENVTKNITVMDVNGSIILSKSTNDLNMEIDLGNEAKGTYFVRVSTPTSISTQYLIKE